VPKTSRTVPVLLGVSITPEMKAALAVASERQGMRPSAFARQAIFLELVKQGYLVPPEQPPAKFTRVANG
jgi:hypothetical protein